MSARFVVMFACLAVSQINSAMGGEVRPSDLIRELEGDFIVSTAATRTIFEQGSSVLDELVSAFSNTAEYGGFCGRQMLQSSSVRVIPQNSDDLEPARRATVREVSLYLIVAIHKQDLYFADACRLVPRGGSANSDPAELFDQLSNSHERSVLTLEEIQRLFKAQGWEFPVSE